MMLELTCEQDERDALQVEPGLAPFAAYDEPVLDFQVVSTGGRSGRYVMLGEDSVRTLIVFLTLWLREHGMAAPVVSPGGEVEL